MPSKHYRIGVDICYSYGLLPVLLQHLAFAISKPGFKPMIGCTILVLVLTAFFWACLLEHLPPERLWLFAAVALSPIALVVNPNWPYSLVVLSILFAFLFVLKNRLDIALAFSAIGCFCIPSLPLVLTVLLALYIVLNWWRTPGRALSRLAALLAPAAVLYAALAVLLGAVFGFASLAATALPLAGARYYKESGYGKAGAFLAFLHPEGYSTKYYIAYYLGSPVTWFVLCTLFLFGLSIFIVASVARGRHFSPAGTLIVVFSLVQAVFIFFAYGARGQYTIYAIVLAAATLVGISTIEQAKPRNVALLLYIVIGMLGESGTAYKTLDAWRTTAPEPSTLGLYAGPGIAANWSEVVRISQNRRTFLLAYATGQHIYYPTLEGPDAWFMLPGLVFPTQEDAIVYQIKQAEVVVEDDTGLSPVVGDKVRAELATMHQVGPGGPYRILEH